MLNKNAKAWLNTWFKYTCHTQIMAPYQITCNANSFINKIKTEKEA
jgi:hypothetical protein